MKNIKKSGKREEILASAVTLFHRTHDIKRVSMEAIAAAAHVSPTTIYNHFGDRDTLIYEVVKNLAKSNIERNLAIVRSDIPFSQKLLSIISGKMAMVDKVNQEIIEKMLNQDEKIAPFVDEIYNRDIKPLWKELIIDGKKQGYIDASVDETAFVLYLDIMQAGLKEKRGIFQGYKENLELIKQLTNLMFYGLLQKKIDLFRKEEE